MHPVNFTEQNCIHRAAGCMDLPTRREVSDEFGVEQVTSCWELSDSDLLEVAKQIQEGKRPAIMLSVIGDQPPVSMYLRK